MRLRKPCEHGVYDTHDWVIDDFGHTRICPGGEFLPEGALVIEKVEGEWPQWFVQSLRISLGVLSDRTVREALDLTQDALASQVGESER